ncbi:MAG: GGDEF domain-containing protein [Desulfuromonadales bacterium]|nr:GGDEF domain-containing protein [Desulfuromonadales bacterium]
MRLKLIRQILTSFLIVCAGFVAAWVAALYVLHAVSGRLAELPVLSGVAAEEVGRLQKMLHDGEIAVLLFGLAGFMGGLIGMVVAASQAANMFGRLKQATQQLANVVLDQELPDSATAKGDDLEHDIREMMLKIQMSQQLCLDASPLTRLPGNIAIEQVLKGKMVNGEKFALCYVDLDDFKAYNDRYGYARGSELIKITGEILYRTKDEYGDPGDFVGHIGGDDFVLITAPENVGPVCEAIIAAFDSAVPEHYEPDDRARGYIEGTDRYGVTRRFPLMSISIAVVTDVKRNFSSPLEIAQVATEIKDYVKSLPGSNYLVDRRIGQRTDI